MLSRRRLLQAGALPWLGVGLPQLLQANAQAADRPTRSLPGQAKSCIFVFQYGGLSQLDSWDPKPQAPAEMRGPYQPIATTLPGLHVGELMPQLAQQAHKYCVLRSLTHKVPVHDVANRMLLAGQALPPADAPSFGAIVSRTRPTGASLPTHVWLQRFGGGAAPPDPSYLTGGSLGFAHSPLLIGETHDDNPAAPGFRVKAFDAASGLAPERLNARRRLLESLAADQPAARDFGGLDPFRERAYDLLTGGAAQRAFDLEQEPTALRDRYGRHPLGQNLLLARRLVESGVRLVSVVGWCGLAPGDKFVSVETWDMHGNAGIDIFGNGWNGLGWALPCCDQGVSALLDDLDQRGLLESTLVVLVGEFGRTPRISRGASAIGRDHWPHCYSAMLAGGGIRGGQVYGASDATAAYVHDRPVTLEDFTATCLTALGIPPETRISPDGFTLRASNGEALPVF